MLKNLIPEPDLSFDGIPLYPEFLPCLQILRRKSRGRGKNTQLPFVFRRFYKNEEEMMTSAEFDIDGRSKHSTKHY
ncbi:unnamed protein product, partial [Mesorhabditis belari]|uniref:Uncharacterized protein n=1 Tax=Mesorhabditis belari TaxID=2138241 RepID=A0AAF3FFS3_9BILA